MSTSQAKILILSANPRSTDRLSIDEEVRAIQKIIRETAAPIEVVSEWAVRADEIIPALLRHRPQVVHFAGHGNESGELMMVGRDPTDIAPVPARLLRDMFAAVSTDTQCVVLYGCFSNAQASALVETIPTAVGLSSQVSDTAAIAFATGFYEVLALGWSVDEAFKAACIRVARTQRASEQETPKLLHGPGVDPQKVTLFPTKTAAKTETKVRSPTAASVRNLLAEVLRTADSLDAFVLDYFPDVHGEFASGMTRDKRRSLLLEMHKPEVVLEKLRRSKPKQVEANESLLEWEE